MDSNLDKVDNFEYNTTFYSNNFHSYNLILDSLLMDPNIFGSMIRVHLLVNRIYYGSVGPPGLNKRKWAKTWPKKIIGPIPD